MYMSDEWPIMPDGADYDGKRLLELTHENRSPFRGQWDALQLVREVEEQLETEIVDIPLVAKGSNYFGIELKTLDGQHLVARLARDDVNMPGFDGFSFEKQVPEVEFEAAVYDILRSEPTIPASRLLHHRVPRLHAGSKSELPTDLVGRRLFVFEKSEGCTKVWRDLSAPEKDHLSDQLAIVRATLFHFDVPNVFADRFVRERIFDFKPASFVMQVAPTREFWIYVFRAKIEATIQNIGDMIGWESDNEVVGPIAVAAKESLLRAIPFILPQEHGSTSLYRFVLEHEDYGVHNMLIERSGQTGPKITSLFDWETACIWPALLSDPLVAISPVDLIVDDCGAPAVTRIPDEVTTDELRKYQKWAEHYLKKLYAEAPDYEQAIKAGKHARHLWYALRDWRGGNAEEFFGGLGAWAEDRIKESNS